MDELNVSSQNKIDPSAKVVFLNPQSVNPDALGQKPKIFLSRAPIKDHEGGHWGSALDCLKELVNDIEHGRVHVPDVIYIAMQTRNDRSQVAYPSYCWSDGKTDGLLMVGLLMQHSNEVLNRR